MIALLSWRTIVLSCVLTLGAVLGSQRTASVRPGVERGRYMVLAGHCNNCHTAGYTKREGNVPEKEWLLGSSPFGYRGTWGTTYASNLRLSVQAFSEVEWVQYARTLRARPPMPWWSLREMSKQDLSAIYRYIKSLGPTGEPGKMYVPPDQEPTRPYEARQLME